MIFYGRGQSTRNLGRHCGTDVSGILQKVDILFSMQRLHCPGVSLNSKGRGKLSIHFAADQDTIDTIYRNIHSVNQLSIYGAVAVICEEFENHQDGPGDPEVLLSKFCMDAGFISVVEIGQYFMTKDTGEQCYAKACREYTFPRSEESSQPKGWIQGNTKIGPVVEITTSCLYGKHGVEIRIWSLNEDNSQSRVRISHQSSKFVIDSNNNTEVPEEQPEEQASQLKVAGFCSQIEGKNKTTKKRTC